MITDDLLRVSEDQTLKLNGTSAVSTDKVDLGTARDIGSGRELYMVFSITTAVSAGTSVQFEAIVASDAALSSDIVTIGDTGAIAIADLTLGKQLAVRLSPQIASLGQRYLGARYSVVGDNSGGAGAVTADIVETVQDGMKFYASGFAV